MNPDEEDPAQDRLSALRQAGFVDALWSVPRWVNLPTSRAKQVSKNECPLLTIDTVDT